MYTFDWIARQAEIRGGRTALVDTATGRELTYADFDNRSSRVAECLTDLWGIRPGDRVAVLAQNCMEYFELLYGCARAGAVTVPLNWRLAGPELDGILADCSPRLLVHEPGFAASVAAIQRRPERTLTLDPGNEESEYEKALRDASGRRIAMPPRDLDDLWYLLYTAGTTGRPKGVMQTFGMVLVNMLNIGQAIDLTSEDVTLNLLPCFHTGGLNMYANPTLMLGGTALIQRSFEPEETFRLLAERATALFGVPAIYLFLSQHPDFAATSFARMRSWLCGGAPLPLSVIECYAARGIVIRQGFGMTETGPTVFVMDADNALTKAGSVGRPQPWVSVRVADREGRDVPPGEVGELLIKGPGVTPGYWRRPDVTSASIVDEWLHSGDVARCDEDGYYYIVDRWKDMFVSGGENVYPAEIENVLFSHPAVAEAAVVGVADERWGEVGRAFVVLKPGQDASEQDLIRFCGGKLARYKIPKSVVFVERLPRNAAGKVVKLELREQPVG